MAWWTLSADTSAKPASPAAGRSKARARNDAICCRVTSSWGQYRRGLAETAVGDAQLGQPLDVGHPPRVVVHVLGYTHEVVSDWSDSATVTLATDIGGL